MKFWQGVLWLLVASLLTTACDKKAEEPKAEKKTEKKTEAPAEPGEAAVEAPPSAAGAAAFVGVWHFEGMEITQAFNSKGRVKVDMGNDQVCLGTYAVEGESYTVTYDEGQPSCLNATMGFSFLEEGEVLSFSGARYRRVNIEDDPSF